MLKAVIYVAVSFKCSTLMLLPKDASTINFQYPPCSRERFFEIPAFRDWFRNISTVSVINSDEF